MTLHEAIKDAGWPADVIAKACKIDAAEVEAYLNGGKPLSRDADAALHQWLTHKVGRAAGGLMYVDPFRPVQAMLPIIAASTTGSRRR